MLEPEDFVFISTISITVILIIISFVLEKRNTLLARHDTERLLSIYGYYNVPLLSRIIGVCWLGRILWLCGIVHSGWLFFWSARFYDRRRTFNLKEKISWESYTIPLTMFVTALSVISAIIDDCWTGELVATIIFSASWILAIVSAYSLERRIPRPHREREIVLTIGAIVIVQTYVALYLQAPWDTMLISILQLIIGSRLIGPHIRHACDNTSEGHIAFFESVYKTGGPIYNASEIMQTPLQEDFLDFCETKEHGKTAVQTYRESMEQQTNTAVFERDQPELSVHDALKILQSYWKDFLFFREHLANSSPNVEHNLEDENSSEEEEDDEIVYTSMIGMQNYSSKESIQN